MVDRNSDDLMRATLAAVAPGTELRDAIERIIRGRTGALIVLGDDETVQQIATGGFPLDMEFSAARVGRPDFATAPGRGTNGQNNPRPHTASAAGSATRA